MAVITGNHAHGHAEEHHGHNPIKANQLGPLFFGAVFAVGVGMEWAEAFEYFPPATQFGSQFFTLTGLHAFHVLSGLIILALVLVNRKANARNAWPVEGAVKYWHFVDLVWVVVYPTLYLVG